MNALAVIVGGALGAMARYMLTFAPGLRRPDDPDASRVPWATFTANIVASFLLGVVIRAFGSGTDALAENLVALLAVGFCGALSTMSSFALELFVMVRARATVSAVGYLTLSLGAAMAAFWLGLIVGQ